MRYIVFDLEWNQGHPSKEGANRSLPFEVIEIGAVKLDENFNIIDSFHRIIKPVVYPVLFKYTREIISLTERELSMGTDFVTACKEFLRWCRKGDRNYFFATWGTLDLLEFQRNMAYYNIHNGFPRPLYYFNVQYLFNIFIGKYDESAISLENAIRHLRLREDKAFHSAISDAQYTAEILQIISGINVFLYPSVDTYKFPLNKKQEVDIVYPDHRLSVSMAYRSKEDLKREADREPYCCHICGNRLRQLVPWYSPNSKNYYYVGECKYHGYMKGKRLIKNPDDHHYFAVSTLRSLSKEQATTMINNYKSRKNNP